MNDKTSETMNELIDRLIFSYKGKFLNKSLFKIKLLWFSIKILAVNIILKKN